MASSKETYCLCGQPYNIGQFMIECDCCREWFHGSCVDVKIYQSDDIDKYHCPKCAQTYGPSVLKVPTNNHRADRYELGAEARPSQAGSPAWVRALRARPPRPATPALLPLAPAQFTEEFVRDGGFTRPIIFMTSEGLEMETPNPATFTARSVLRFCGAQLEIEVIDVRRQSTLRMPLGEFVEYFETAPELRAERVLNVLSLEFSDTNLSPLVEPPGTIRRLDWAAQVSPAPRPAVQKYCLLSPAGAYTDFHVDFGGTAVWYHVMYGRKIFYLIPPTSTNLALYQQWSASNNQNERFFGDMVEWYGTAELCAGQTLCIPGGWVHAVLTPEDALVFGGNLLHSYSIEMQLQIYEIERLAETPPRLRYPLFEALHWHAAAHLLQLLRRHNEDTQDEDFTPAAGGGAGGGGGGGGPAPPAPLLLRGAKLLASALKEWHALKTTEPAKRDNVPKCINSGQLVRELARELRTLDKRAASAANKDKDFKLKSHVSPHKAGGKRQAAPRRALKLTLPKPIMHMPPPAPAPAPAPARDKLYADKLYIDNKEVVFDNTYAAQDMKYNGIQDTKYLVESKEVLPEKYTFQHYEEPAFPDSAYDRQDHRVLTDKYNTSPCSSRAEPPPYRLPEHSILKSHLSRARPALKSAQWTISKKDLGYQEEQILFTNENTHTDLRVEQEISYGPGMYSAEDIQQDYQYSEAAKPGSYHPAYGYPGAPDLRIQAPLHTQLQPASFAELAAHAHAPAQPPSYAPAQPPSYAAALAQQYAPASYVPEQPAPAPAPVRRSERPPRRRLSHSYDYEDGDLFLDDAPAPRRRRHKPRPAPPQSQSAYRAAAPRPPVSGIESLIQASVLAGEPDHMDTSDAAVAVEGMLSISRGAAPPDPAAPASPTTPTTPTTPDPARPADTQSSSGRGRGGKRARRPEPEPEPEPDDEDVIKEVHRDEEYVYPSLEMSSDEEEEWGAARRRPPRGRPDARGRGDKDECWSPRARLGRLLPRVRGPARAGVRRECVRAALHHAHAHHHAHRAGRGARPEQNAKRAVLATKSKRPPPAGHDPPNNKNSRLKKGMKTAKQRLGKILKIHKMVY